MRKSRFTAVSMMVIFSLVLLVTVETIWVVRTYREMESRYEQQIEAILEEAAWRYATPTMDGAAAINIGNISRFHAFVGECLRTSSVTTRYRVEVLTVTASEPIVLMAMGEEWNNERIISVDKNFSPLILRLMVDDPHAEILGSMRWIITLQILSVVVLAATFIFLLRTLFRAKEVDRIRRDLTHNITHELKTPIAAAHAATEALRTMPAIAEDRATRNDYLDMTLGELRRLNNMVEEILRGATEEFANTKLRLEKCDVRGIVEEVRSSLDMRYRKLNVTWQIDIDDDCSVAADSFHLKGAISAIVDNAIKYSVQEPKVLVCATTKRGYTYIKIEDNGMGIPQSEHKRIFEKFYRITHGDSYATSGYGVGLYYAMNVARHHGGDITLHSTIGQGSCFTIKLPRYGM